MNIKQHINLQQAIMLCGLILFGIIGRYILVGRGVQPFPNFEIIMVTTFLAMMMIRSPLALIVPLASMIGSDLLIGNPIFIGSQMNRIVLFTYSGFALIALISAVNKQRLWASVRQVRLHSLGLFAGLGAGFVLLYDIWTNLGWWYLMYPHNGGSLLAVFTAGLPFMAYHMISGILTFILIGLPVVMYVNQKKDQRHQQPFPVKKTHVVPALVLVISLVVLSFAGTAMRLPEKSEIWLEDSDLTSVRITIRGEGWTISDSLVAYHGDTALSLLERCAATNDFTIETTYYEQFDSTFVTAINNAVGGTQERYWQYYVNGESPLIGADNYLVSNGDVVLWSFEALPL